MGPDGREYLYFPTLEEAQRAFPEAWIDPWETKVSGQLSGNGAYGFSRMRYFGTDAEQAVTLTTIDDEGRQFVVSQRHVDDHILPNFYTFNAPNLSAPFVGARDCGGKAQVSGNYVAEVNLFIQVKGVTRINHATHHSSANIPRAVCPPDEERDVHKPGSGGGGGECTDCKDVEKPAGPTYCRVRYKYWKDTGEVYEATILWCA